MRCRCLMYVLQSASRRASIYVRSSPFSDFLYSPISILFNSSKNKEDHGRLSRCFSAGFLTNLHMLDADRKMAAVNQSSKESESARSRPAQRVSFQEQTTWYEPNGKSLHIAFSPIVALCSYHIYDMQ